MPEADTTTEYRDIDGFPGYKVGSDGSIWSLGGQGRKRNKFWRQMKCMTGSGGYRAASLRPDGQRKRGGKVERLRVHTFVLLVFRGPPPESGMLCRHLDGDPANNHLSNLAWGTMTENMADRTAHGRSNKGSRHGMAKLSEADIPIVRQMHRNGVAAAVIATQLGVGEMTIRDIVKGRSWQHVP